MVQARVSPDKCIADDITSYLVPWFNIHRADHRVTGALSSFQSIDLQSGESTATSITSFYCILVRRRVVRTGLRKVAKGTGRRELVVVLKAMTTFEIIYDCRLY